MAENSFLSMAENTRENSFADSTGDETRPLYNLIDQVGDWDDAPLLPTPPERSSIISPPQRRSSTFSPQRSFGSPRKTAPSLTARRTVRTPDRFDGKSSWRLYAAHFEAVGKINGWTGVEASTHLAACLSGGALRVLYPVPRDDYGDERPLTLRELVSRLEARYGAGDIAESYLTTLKSLNQGKKSLHELSDEVQELVVQAYPDADWAFVERMSVIHYKDAVSDSEVRAAVHRCKPATLEAAVNAAIEAESWQRMEASRHPPQRYQQSARTVSFAPDETVSSELKEFKVEVMGLFQEQQRRME